MNRIFLIHGWGGSPNSDWFPWAKEELEKMGFEVVVPEMPDTNHPKIDLWVNKLKAAVGEPRDSDIFVGHSIGCQTILRYLETLTKDQIVNKVILIAPWWYLTLGKDEQQTDANPWLNTLVNFEEVKSKANKFVCVFSDNDPFVPLDINKKFFEDKLKPEIMVKDKAGHFTEGDGMSKIEFLLYLVK